MTTTESSELFAPGRRANPQLIRDIVRAMRGQLDAEERLALEWTVAEDVRRHLDGWKRPEVPERPLALPDNDEEVVRMVRGCEGARPSPAEVEAGEAFGAWRYAVWRSETDGAARLRTLFGALATYERILERLPGDPGLEASRVQLVRFLAEEWGHRGPRPQSYEEERATCHRLSRRSDVLPSWLAALRLPHERRGAEGL